MRASGLRRRVFGLAAALALLAGSGVAAADTAGSGLRWTGAWAASPQQANPPIFEPDWSQAGFADQSVRQIVRLSTGGPTVRIRLSNAYGKAPLRLAGATVARAGTGAAVQPGSVRHLTFGHQRAAEIPAGGELASDPALLWTAPLERLAVTLYFAEPTGPATYHWFASATSYRAAGDHRADPEATAFTETTRSWYYLAGVDVGGVLPQDAVVAFGDSITDGAGSTVDADNRYPDDLAERLAAAGRPRGVLNEGIGGNRVLNDSPCFGERATKRFQRDALDQPGVRTVIVLEGINDIGASDRGEFECFTPRPEVTAAQLIAGHRELIAQARSRGLKVIGATLLPYKGAMYYSERGEAVRDEVNSWIRTSGEYDAVVDLDRATADPADPDTLRPAYDSGDHLHPNDAGYHAMAEAFDLSAL
ncbi:SGNH/GDSL hydrolase family protein [Amycolatopsis anabasis]|uniref:SGNH/GDSL hydrolase family protein n=1 Tax=Amycolatopsis anabasis TaxID=1840409 RepID=UPI00131B335F|nr:SGNH/GDSL hydrolase family protein [Amycolatopsis anabasis]